MADGEKTQHGPVVRAKFQVQSKRDYMGYAMKDGKYEPAKLTEVILSPVSSNSEDNKSWSEATPCGELKMSITNPAAVDALELGKSYLLDFTPAE